MRAKLVLFIIMTLGFTVISNAVFSQQTAYGRSSSATLHQARELYSKNEFVAAGNLFASIAGKSDARSDEHAEATFFHALCALRLGTAKSEELMRSYIKKFPESIYINKARFELAGAQFDNGRYEEVLRVYPEVDISGLSQEERAKMTYQTGYSLLQAEKYAEAEREFEKIKNSGSNIAAPARYYWAHIKYMNGEYDQALQAFEQLKDNEAFAPIIPHYTSQIYYMQGRYAEVVNLTEPLMQTADAQQRASLSRLLANSYFQLDEFGKAIPYFETYFDETGSKQRAENYMLGYCYYFTGRYAEAISFLENGSAGNDMLAQNAFYHLADSYIKAGDKNKARIAFEAASEMDFNAEIKEDALFNFAKITYELSYSPFNETIRAFDKYISLYPYSGRNADAYNYLVQVYMSTNNFKEAAASIEKISVKSPAIRKAWQRVAFHHGLELFNSMAYRESIESFNKSLSNAEFDNELKARATFWKAEANYHIENYQQALDGYNSFISMRGISAIPEYQTASYSLGYVLFKKGDYDRATSSFKKFIEDQQNRYENKSNNPNSDKLGDAYNRLADCYFISRDYRNAIKNYEQAFALNTYDPDYALYQKALCLGLQQEQEQKISSLRSLLQIFPESAMAADAMFELGRTYERLNEPKVAIGYYNDLLEDYPLGKYQTKALFQLGLMYYNLSDYQTSLEYYKKITENYPNSPEAQPALLGIRNDYIELNNVDAYLQYANQLGSGSTISSSEQDSLSYMAAEKLVMSGNTQARAQLERYLQQFPRGSFSLNARFYLAESKYTSGEYSSALADYEYVLAKEDNIFTEPALMKAAELKYNAKDYDNALSLYSRLEKISTIKWNLLKARAGKMRSYFELGKYNECSQAARVLLSTENITDVLKREANFKLAKSLYQKEDYLLSMPVFGELAKDTKSQEGAESKYILAEILSSQNKLDEAENEIMDFISKSTPHQFWLAKSFILLSDIYLRKGDEFQARHTLRSIVENYPVKEDGIIETAGNMMKRLEELEKQQQQENESPMQIEINKK